MGFIVEKVLYLDLQKFNSSRMAKMTKTQKIQDFEIILQFDKVQRF